MADPREHMGDQTSSNTRSAAPGNGSGGETQSADAGTGDGRVIKRYANRKLYDTQRSRYVTLDQIAEMIREGEDVRIIDNNSKEDLTSVTLAQILFEEEKKKKSFLSLKAMRDIIQSGGQRFEEVVSQAKQQVSKVGTVFGRAPGAGPSAPIPGEGGAEAEGRMVRELRDWVETSSKTIEEWRRRMDDRVQSIQHAVTVTPLAALKKELTVLTNRIGELEERLTKAGRDDVSKPD